MELLLFQTPYNHASQAAKDTCPACLRLLLYFFSAFERPVKFKSQTWYQHMRVLEETKRINKNLERLLQNARSSTKTKGKDRKLQVAENREGFRRHDDLRQRKDRLLYEKQEVIAQNNLSHDLAATRNNRCRRQHEEMLMLYLFQRHAVLIQLSQHELHAFFLHKAQTLR